MSRWLIFDLIGLEMFTVGLITWIVSEKLDKQRPGNSNEVIVRQRSRVLIKGNKSTEI